MLNHMVLKHKELCKAMEWGFVPMLNHMVLKPQIQHLAYRVMLGDIWFTPYPFI